jgi:hypothetical protein
VASPLASMFSRTHLIGSTIYLRLPLLSTSERLTRAMPRFRFFRLLEWQPACQIPFERPVLRTVNQALERRRGDSAKGFAPKRGMERHGWHTASIRNPVLTGLLGESPRWSPIRVSSLALASLARPVCRTHASHPPHLTPPAVDGWDRLGWDDAAVTARYGIILRFQDVF